ncbi:MAG: hypothetical protein JW720_08090, partial [Sedimentisphaerales bacterium]|nr:hypothetical protein [Sedimentisphaerales bacterium]
MNRMGNGRIGRGIAVIVIMGLSCVSARADYSGGTGEPNDPFQIATVADWQELMAATGDWGRHFLLTADLDMNGVAMTPVGNYANRFTGVFDGNDHVIGNVDINMPNAYYVGLFGYVDSGADIRNIGIEDANIAGKYYVGGLVGYNSNGSITDCYATGPVTGDDRVGGLVGRNKDGDISNCYATGSVDGYDYVGGLVGGNFNGSITDCCATGPVTGDYRVGGLVGRN